MCRCVLHGSCYLVSLSNQHGGASLATPILGFLLPILTLFTAVTNTIIIHILLRLSMACHSDLYKCNKEENFIFKTFISCIFA